MLVMFIQRRKSRNTINSCVFASFYLYACDLWTNQKGNTALHVASLAGKLDVVKVLLVNGASVNARSQASIVRSCSLVYHPSCYSAKYYVLETGTVLAPPFWGASGGQGSPGSVTGNMFSIICTDMQRLT